MKARDGGGAPADALDGAPDVAGTERALRPLARAALLAIAWGLFVAAGPGAIARSGLPAVGVLAIGVWASATARPGRFAFLVEWLLASAGFAGLLEWIRHVSPGALVPTALGMGLYAALAGPLLRRLARRRVVFPIAVALAWTSAETLRALYPPPIGHGWLRLGHLAVAWPAVLEGARVVSVVGLSFALAALGGLVAALARLQTARARGLYAGEHAGRDALELAASGLAPLVAVLLAGTLVDPPATRTGPRLLLVQPAITQDRKLDGRPPTRREILDEQISATRNALQDLVARGERLPDLVCWAETMLPLDVLDDRARAGIAAGVPAAPWSGLDDSRALLECDEIERQVVHGELLGRLGRKGVLPPGVAFLAGVECWTERDGELRRLNAIALWPADGGPRQLAAKRFLVPGAEGMMGLERHQFVRDWIRPVAGYVPDFVPAERTGVLELAVPARGGFAAETWRFGASVCFDNAFLEPYLEPLRDDGGRVDFHVVASNEAWYRGAWELDQMIAFSQAAAAASGRALVRVTNSGVTAWITPDGRLADKLVVTGRDRDVQGALVVDVAAPALGADGRAPVPPAVNAAPWLRWLFLLLGPLALLAPRRAQPLT